MAMPGAIETPKTLREPWTLAAKRRSVLELRSEGEGFSR